MNCELQARTMTASHQQLLCSLSALAIFQFLYAKVHIFTYGNRNL